jgi:transmembrane sensor
MTPSAEQIRTAVSQQAGDWFVMNEAGTLDASERSAFVAWLKASPLHVQEYLGIALVARDLPIAADNPKVSVETLLSEVLTDADDTIVSLDQSIPTHEPPLRRSMAVRGWSFAAPAAVVLLGSAIWWARDGEVLGLPKTYRTAHGEQMVTQLPDGSLLHLNTDSAVTVRYSSSERLVSVDRGEALFDVAHDNQRRLRVAAGEGQVVAVGTQFDVYRKPDSTVVTVVEGTVALFAGDARPTGSGAVLPDQALRVGAGYQVRIDAGSGWGQPVPVDAQASVAWLHREIVFQARPLGEVADEFNRYSQILIEIDDPALRALPVSGLFNAYDTDSFATFLQTLDGVAVQRTPIRIRAFNLSTEELPSADR